MSRSETSKNTVFIVVVAFILCLTLTVGSAQEAPPSGLDSAGIIGFLNQSIVWYRQLATEQELADEPSDVVFLNDNRRIGDQVVKLSFEFARAEAQILSTQKAVTRPNSTDGLQGGSSRYQALLEAVKKSDQQVKNSQQQILSLREQMANATARKRHLLQAAISENESELELLQVRRDALQTMVEFASGTTVNGLASGSLRSEIDELARTIPAAGSDNDKQTSSESSSAAPAAVTVPPRKSEPSGILASITDLIRLRRKVHTLDNAIQQTDSLLQAAKSLRSPMVAKIKELAQRGNDIASQPDAQDPAVLAEQKKQVDQLTAQFKQLSSAVLPLRKQSILLNLYKRNVSSWREAVAAEYSADLKGFVVRIVLLAVILAFVLALSNLWRRATFRYVQDARRRYQFLLLRRIVVWSLITVIVAVSFASELGTLATFAGLLTAGVAVALQNVILSVAGYFFLIGKYGVRVGDRVQVCGVTGQVIDIGLVRLHLMEIDGSSSMRPTGRVVVFSNAVIFQPNAGLFKQIPGTKFDWHEITLTVAPDSDYRHVEERLMTAVNVVFTDYSDGIDSQRRNMEQNLRTLSAKKLLPESRLRLTQSGLEVIIRYPVELDNAAEVDDRITRELLDAIESEPKLRLVGSSTPNLQVIREDVAVGSQA